MLAYLRLRRGPICAPAVSRVPTADLGFHVVRRVPDALIFSLDARTLPYFNLPPPGGKLAGGTPKTQHHHLLVDDDAFQTPSRPH